jgi:hypothetical protein
MSRHTSELTLLAAIISLNACASPEGRRAQLDDNPPTEIQFRLTPLVKSTEPDSQLSDTTWSQNDYADSVAILVANTRGMPLLTVTVDLIAESRTEGDAPIEARARRAVAWKTLHDGTADSLPTVAGGRLLLNVRPSALWDHVQAQLGPSFVPSSLIVRVALDNRSEITRSLTLLWD